MLPEFSSDELKTHLQTYSIFMLCHSLGEGSVYERFLHRQKENGDANAVAILDSVEAVASILKSVDNFSEIMNSFGKGRVVDLLNSVKANEDCSMHVRNGWTLCILSGQSIPQSLSLQNMNVDLTYKPFLHALWIVLNVKFLIVENIRLFLQQVDGKQKTEIIIEKFKQSLPTDTYETYSQCYAFVFATFRLSLEALQNQRGSLLTQSIT